MVFRYHISWVGSYTERVIKGIYKVNPDFISFLIESSTEDWTKFQMDCLKDIINHFGKSLGYLFCWDEIPGEDSGRLIEFLGQNFNVDWVKTAKIEKTDDNKSINVSLEKNYLSLRLNNEKVTLTIDNGKTDEFSVKIENGKPNIYDKGSSRMEIVSFPSQKTTQEEISKAIFKKLFTMIHKKQEEMANVQITIDVTAAPKTMTYILTFLAMALSTKDSHIKILYTPKAFESIPCYYAPMGSDFSKECELSLAKYRSMEKDDKGGDTLFVELPIADFEIFSESSPRTPYLLSVFMHIPGSKSNPKKSSVLLEEITASDKELLEKYASKAEKSEDTKEKAIHTKLSLALQQFEKWGIVELNREGRWFLVKKTWAGDLISPVTEDLYYSKRKSL